MDKSIRPEHRRYLVLCLAGLVIVLWTIVNAQTYFFAGIMFTVILLVLIYFYALGGRLGLF